VQNDGKAARLLRFASGGGRVRFGTAVIGH